MEDGDADGDFAEQENAFLKAEAMVMGLRQEYDQRQRRQQEQQ